jgi:CDP-paratose 2-epimerase
VREEPAARGRERALLTRSPGTAPAPAAAHVHDLLALDRADLGPEDLVFVPAVTANMVLALARWIASFPPARAPHFGLCLMFQPDWHPAGRPTAAGELFDRRAFPFVPAALRARCIYTCETAGLADEYAPYVGARPLVAPIPTIQHLLLEDDPRPAAERPIAFLGYAKAEKGFHLRPEVVAEVRRRRPRTRFLVQLMGHDEALVGGVREALRAHGEQVELIEGPVAAPRMVELMGRSGLVLMPYDPATSRTRGSAIFTEACSVGVPLVLPAGTAAALTAAAGGYAETFERWDVPGVVRATLRALARLKALTAAARREAARRRRERPGCLRRILEAAACRRPPRRRPRRCRREAGRAGEGPGVSVAIVTGWGGLIGSETVAHFAEAGLDVVGIDNDMRRYFFGDEASTAWQVARLRQAYPRRFRAEAVDIRDAAAIEGLFADLGRHIALVVHCAAQPSHDWAAREPVTDFTVNANGTLTLLEAARRHAPEAVFVFTSTNKVYGDRPNALPLVELPTRYEIAPDHPYRDGIPESMPIDQCLHSLFGASKVAADVLVQEYGRYFGLRTGVFRGGCLTGPNHAGAELHGFLSYLMRCTATGRPYTVMGYRGKQVRDNIHSADLVRAFDAFFRRPRAGEVYNIGGGRASHCSMLEAIGLCEEIAGRPLAWSYRETSRTGDHIWYVSDLSRFRSHYPEWSITYDVPRILAEIHEANRERWGAAAAGAPALAAR